MATRIILFSRVVWQVRLQTINYKKTPLRRIILKNERPYAGIQHPVTEDAA